MSNNVHPDEYPLIEVYDKKRELAAFDRLPHMVQIALREAPFQLSAEATLALFLDCGEAKTLDEIAASIKEWLVK